MKKVLLLFAGVAFLGIASCSKSGTCECGGEIPTAEYEDLNKEEYDAAKSSCENAGCTWSDK